MNQKNKLENYLSELEQVEKLATPGPWHFEEDLGGSIEFGDEDVVLGRVFTGPEQGHNILFVTKSRNAFSKLLQIIRLQDEALEESINRADDYADSFISQPIRKVRAEVQKIVGGE